MPGLVIERASVMDLPTSNGVQQPLTNGTSAKMSTGQNGGRVVEAVDNAMPKAAEGEELKSHHGLVNGVAQKEKQNGMPVVPMNRLDGLPTEIKQLTEHLRPFHKLVNRSVQQTWNNFSDLLDQLSEINLAPSNTTTNASYGKSQLNGAVSGEQSRENLEKKERLLNFQNDQRALYIKLLVLHDWYKKSRGIDQTIEISMWMHEQRAHYLEAADFIGLMKRELAVWQVPNPDLQTAIEVLSKGRVSSFSNLGYVPQKPLSSKGMLRTLQDLNILLCRRLSLEERLPLPMSKYKIHDGRVTFIVPYEFELDLSVADEDPSSQFYFIDFKYLFLQRSPLPNGRLREDFAARIDDILKKDGLLGCYDFLHDLTLSYKLNSFRRQALDLARKQWSENLKVDLINRTLVVQYWKNRPMPKSWIEVGIKSGRRKRKRDAYRTNEPFLDLRWKPEKDEQEIEVDFNASPLSTENLLHGVISRHSSRILEGIYEKLLEAKLYAEGRLSLELSCSNTEPSNCSLQIQLTDNNHVTLSFEPISGSMVLQPASSLSGRTEFELNRLANPVAEGVPHITMLRCLAAEQEIAMQAKVAGWEVLQTFRLSHGELRNLFPQNDLRYLLIRQPAWQPNVMIAATLSMEGDRWWLIYPTWQDTSGTQVSLISQPIDCPPLQDSGMASASFFAQLEDYASGAVSFKVAEQDLRRKQLFCELSALPRFKKDYQLPFMKVRYLLANSNRALKPSLSESKAAGDQAENSKTTDRDRSHENPSWVQPTVYIKFCGLNKRTHNALLLAKGRTTAPVNVLESLTSLSGSGFKVIKGKNEFVMSFQVPIGDSVVSELFTKLQNLDSLLSCLTIVKSFDSVQVHSLSLSQIVLEYNKEANLSVSLDLPSHTSSAVLRLLPAETNPHARISGFMEILLGDHKRPFTANLGGLLTLLITSYPLLAAFDELEKLQFSPDITTETSNDRSSLKIRLHIIARSPTHYALQYFTNYTNTRTMIARFEIFRHLRRDTPVWIMRPALEEHIAYSRSSFVDVTLKHRLLDKVFNLRGAQGWLGLDTGASCPISSPGPLVRKVDGVVRAWATESLPNILAHLQRPDSSSALEAGKKSTEPKREANIPSNPQQHHQQQHPQQQPPQQQQSRAPRPATTASGQNRPANNAQRPPPPQGQPKPKDVITLD